MKVRLFGTERSLSGGECLRRLGKKRFLTTRDGTDSDVGAAGARGALPSCRARTSRRTSPARSRYPIAPGDRPLAQMRPERTRVSSSFSSDTSPLTRTARQPRPRWM